MMSSGTYDVISDIINFSWLVCPIYPPYGGKALVIPKIWAPFYLRTTYIQATSNTNSVYPEDVISCTYMTCKNKVSKTPSATFVFNLEW